MSRAATWADYRRERERERERRGDKAVPRLLLATTLLVFGCSKPSEPKPGPTSGLPEATPIGADPERAAKYGNTDASKVGVELVESGREPRRALRYVGTANYTALSHMRLTITKKKDGSSVRDSSFVHSAFVESSFHETITVVQTMMADKNGELVGERDQLGDDELQHFGVAVEYNNRGRPLNFEALAGDSILVKRYQPELMNLMMAPWLPEEPVGIGAKWQVRTPVSVAQPIRANKVTVSELVAIEGAVITIETTITSDAPQQKVNGREYVRQKIRGKKRITVDLTDAVSLVPRSFENVQDMSMTRRKPLTTYELSTKITSERLSDAVIQDSEPEP